MGHFSGLTIILGSCLSYLSPLSSMVQYYLLFQMKFISYLVPVSLYP